MIYAPVIIPTLCRVDKLRKCIESLQRNPYAKYTEIYISLDYPPNEKYRQGYEQTKEYLRQRIEGFARVEILKQKENKGWQGNYELLRDKVYETHECYIFSEDDNVFSPNFLEYLDRCLTEFEHDEDILSVSGYSYPLDWQAGENNVVKVNSYFSAWGYGTWKKKEEAMLAAINLDNFESQMRNPATMQRLYHSGRNQYCNFVKGMIGYTDMLFEDGEVISVDLSDALYQIFNGKYTIFPTISKVRNMGYGGDGVHCAVMEVKEGEAVNHRNYPYDQQPIDESLQFEKIIVKEVDETERLNRLMEEFFTVSTREIVASRITQFICHIGGRGLLMKLLEKRRRKCEI